MKVWEVVVLSFLGLMAMGRIDNVGSSMMDVGSYGTSTGDSVSLLFFLFTFAVIGIVVRSYFNE